jgi:hypothetical protein
MAEKREDHDQDDDTPGLARTDDAAKREFRGSFPDDANPSEPDWTTLCTLTPAQAEALRHRLDAAGIPCELHELTSAAAPADHETQATVAGAVRVQVLEEDLEAAEEVASRAAFAEGADDPDDEEDPAEHEARMLANWFCPKCRKQELELLPRKRSWYRLANLFLAILIVPWIIAFAIEATADRRTISAFHRQTDWLIGMWLVIIVVYAGLLLGAHRDRRCKACGWTTLQSKPPA